MVLSIENILLVGSFLLLISIIAGKTSFRFGIPTLILFLVIGMLSGSEGIGGIHFNDPALARFIGVVSLNFILFSGGLDTNWKAVKPVLWQGVSLSTLGVLLTALTLGIFTYLITDFSLYEGLLLGAIVSSTDAAAVFSILRSKKLALKQNLRPTLELESGSNDPMAYVLTISFLNLVLHPEEGLLSVLQIFLLQMVIGGVFGYLSGRISKFIINKIALDFDGLYPVLVIALMFITYSFTDAVGGNGFLAVYVCAVYLGNQQLIHKKSILQVYDGLAWLMQIVLFLTLGLLVFPSEIIPVLGSGILISLFLIIIARPFSVLVSLLPFRMRFRRRIYISWVGLRGAVPIVFATYPLLAGIDKANLIFHIVFFVSLTSVLIQGTSISLVAKWLKVVLPEKTKSLKSNFEILSSDEAKNMIREIKVPEGGVAAGKKIVELNFPKSAIIAIIKRGNQYITPNGNTVLESGDNLVILSDSPQSIKDVTQCLGANNRSIIKEDQNH
ncbi:potassium/proton antiporter [Thermophagus sp. OGC60D27]|uniref:potassium/proton antiporter n=1 Tax=Thermophagus sp. OGC60D27 TaxID=3458415 RepID=UPI004037BF3A